MNGLRKSLEHVAWGIRVQRAYTRIGFVRKSQFRWEFLNQVVMDVLYYASFILTFEILYGLEGAQGGSAALELAGWTHDEMKVFLGMAFIADALVMTFLGQTWHFGVDLKNGALDSFRVRPGSTAFLYFFQRFSPEGLTNLLIASSWLVYALACAMPELVEPWHVAWSLPIAIATIAWIQPFLSMAFQLVELWVLDSSVGHLASNLVSTLGDRPLEIYPNLLGRTLLFAIPIAGAAWYPASLVLGRLEPGFALLYPLVLVAFALVVTRTFRRGLRRYESAMS